MSKILYTSDWHLFHNNILNLADRPFSDIEEMHKKLIENYTRKVNSKDEVWFVGDMGMYHAEEIAKIIRNLPGRKYLIKGNHDIRNLECKNLRMCFAKIVNYAEIVDKGRHVILSHYPFEEWNGFYRGWYHVHGHVHNKAYRLNQISNRFNASVDDCGFAPCTLDAFIQKQEAGV